MTKLDLKLKIGYSKGLQAESGIVRNLRALNCI